MDNFERSLQSELNSHENNLSPNIQRKLKASRQTALEQHQTFRIPRVFIPVASMALASVAAFFLIFSPLPSVNDTTSSGLAGDNAPFSQDLDFYYWLAETENVVGS